MKKDYTHISIVLDRSGSMASIATDTIGGFNSFVDGQRNVPGECTVTLVQFDDVIETLHDAVKVADIPALDAKRYQPRNNTALYDAVGKTIGATGRFLANKPEDQRAEKVVFVILTDGEENASHEFTRDKIFEMITRQREQYKWEFVFIGANQDAYAAGRSMGISHQNSINHTANSTGTQSLYASAGANLKAYRSGAKADMSWEADQLKAQEDAKTP